MTQSKDESEIIEALIETNRQRVKTNEQIGREAQRLWDIEQERAEIRKKENQQNRLALLNTSQEEVVNLPPPLVNKDTNDNKGKTRDKVGEKIGTSGKKAEQAKTVVDTIDELKEEGKQQEAEVKRVAPPLVNDGTNGRKSATGKTHQAGLHRLRINKESIRYGCSYFFLFLLRFELLDKTRKFPGTLLAGLLSL